MMIRVPPACDRCLDAAKMVMVPNGCRTGSAASLLAGEQRRAGKCLRRGWRDVRFAAVATQSPAGFGPAHAPAR